MMPTDSQIRKVFNYYAQLPVKYQENLYKEIVKYYQDEELQKIDK
tara:strand:+ start:999 stop:1133 length:135 start_codon:yes stop_codon:yes gene_type:complete